MDYKQLRKLKV